MTVIEIDIISDIVCIWCYVGKRTLERAISMYQKTYPGGKHDIFSVKWHPYYLQPDPSTQSVDKHEVMEKKLAEWTPEKRAAVSNRVNQIGRSVGIDFKFGGKIGSTRYAHRLIHFSQQSNCSPEVQDALVEELFEAYHEKEMDISDRSVLHEIATGVGLAGRDIDECLNSTAVATEVDDEQQKYRSMTNSGVPMFIIQGQHRVDGAQDFQEFFEAFVKVKEAESEL